jgi:hypothetical protein
MNQIPSRTHAVVYCPKGHANLVPPRVCGPLPQQKCRCGEVLKYMSPSRKPA